MTVSLAGLVAPASTAVLTVEMQRGIAGDLSQIEDLRREVEAGEVVTATALMLDAARGAGIPVVHGTVSFRPDRRGSPANAPMLAVAARSPGHLLLGSDSAALVPDLDDPTDLVVERHHGVCPFTGTGLDALLRSLGVTTVVLTGVSVNMGIFGTVIEAVGLGYRVVVARDAVAGTPKAYADDVLDNSVRLLAHLSTTADLIACWSTLGPVPR